MPAPRDIDRMIDKYRLHRQARAGEPLVVDERTRERLMSVVEDQYGNSGFVSSREAAEKYAESPAWQKGIERWWHRMVPWIGFAGVCCLALIVIFVAANHDKDSKQALVQGPDLMDEIEQSPAAEAAAAPAPTPEPRALKSAAPIGRDESAAGAAPRPAPAPAAKSAVSSPIVIQAPLPDPSAPIAEETRDDSPADRSSAMNLKPASPPRTTSAVLDANTAPASAMVPVGGRTAPAKAAALREPAPAGLPGMTGTSPEPISPTAIESLPVYADAAAPMNPAPQTVPTPPKTPIVWTAPPSAAGAAGAPTPVSAPAATPRMQKFRSTGPVPYRRTANAATGFAIMGQFDLLTTGSRVTVKDADGSIYSGRVISAKTEEFAFRVAGVNRTSRLRVEFIGNYSPTPSASDAQAQTSGAGLQGELKIGGGQSSTLTARRIR